MHRRRRRRCRSPPRRGPAPAFPSPCTWRTGNRRPRCSSGAGPRRPSSEPARSDTRVRARSPRCGRLPPAARPRKRRSDRTSNTAP
ncbi:MAG: hypothetical protein F4Z33_02700 [Gemmatimonadales bacterium]|nr:hypothetical protein [Gemmatimonadales bacterium]